MFVASALLVLWYVRKRWVKILGITLLVAVPLLVAYGRLYRGMHHPTDIVGSYINGLTCIAIAAASASFGPLGARGGATTANRQRPRRRRRATG